MKYDHAYTCDEKKFYSHLIHKHGMEYAEKFYITVQRFKATLESPDCEYANEIKPEVKS